MFGALRRSIKRPRPLLSFGVFALAIAFVYMRWPAKFMTKVDAASIGDWAQAFAAVLALPVVEYARKSLRENRRIAVLNKRADVIMHCAERYDELYRDRQSLKREGNDEFGSLMYYNRYWGLKSDQIDYYIAGWIDPDTLRSWLYSTYLAMRSEVRSKAEGRLGLSMIDSWSHAKAYHIAANPYFAEITEVLFEAAAASSGPRNDIAVINTVLQQLEARTSKERAMIQRKYFVAEYLGRLRRRGTLLDHEMIMSAARRPIHEGQRR